MPGAGSAPPSLVSLEEHTYMAAIVNPNLNQFPVLQVHDAVIGEFPVPVFIELQSPGHTLGVLARHQHSTKNTPV